MEIRLRGLGALLLAGLLIGLVAAGCGSDTSPTSHTVETATATAAPTSTPPRLAFLTPGAVSAAPTKAPTVASSAGTGSAPSMEDPMGDDPLAIGEKIFVSGSDKKDQIGCQYCHAPDGRGNIGPNIRGKTAGDVEFALDNVEAMIFLRLNQPEIEGIAEYLQWLATQP